MKICILTPRFPFPENGGDVLRINNKMFLLGIILLSMLFLAIYGIIMSKSNGEIFDTVFTGYATIFTLINVLVISCLSVNYKHSGLIGKIIKLIGSNTLGIYLIHVFIGSLLIMFYKTIEILTNIIINLLFALIILMFSLFTIIILKKLPLIKELFKIG
jgi:fucose 4-O-acetylase-like acetyltransferase